MMVKRCGQQSERVQEGGGSGECAVEAGKARGVLGDDGRDDAVDPDFAEGGGAHRFTHHAVEGDEGGHGSDAVHAEKGNGLGEAGDLAPDAEERGVGEAEEFGGKGRVELDKRRYLVSANLVLAGEGEDAMRDGRKWRQEAKSPWGLGVCDGGSH